MGMVQYPPSVLSSIVLSGYVGEIEIDTAFEQNLQYHNGKLVASSELYFVMHLHEEKEQM